MNILILSDSGFKGFGMELYCEVLAKVNAKLNNRVLKVDLNTRKHTSEEQVKSNDIITLKGTRVPVIRAIYDKPFTRDLTSLCKKFKVDIIHANILNARYPLNIIRVSHKLKLPLVITIHGWSYLCPIGFNLMLPEQIQCEKSSFNAHCIDCAISRAKLISVPPLSFTYRMLYQAYVFGLFVREADCVISPSKTFAKKLHEKLGVRAYHIPNPIDPKILKEEPFSRGDGSVLFLGRIEYEKGVHLLPILAKILNNVKIHVIGKGRLTKLFLKNEFSNIFYHGYVSESEKLGLLRKASAVVVPSIYCDMFPTTVLEAFTFGKPVVAFDWGGPKEQIESSGGGLLARPFEIEDFAEKVSYLLENPAEAKKMGFMGRRWVEESLTPDRYGEMLTKVYDSALGCKYD